MQIINLNCITNSCNWNTRVTWQGNEYELLEDDTIVSKHVGSVIIYKLIVIVLLLVILQNDKKNTRDMYLKNRGFLSPTSEFINMCARSCLCRYAGVTLQIGGLFGRLVIYYL